MIKTENRKDFQTGTQTVFYRNTFFKLGKDLCPVPRIAQGEKCYSVTRTYQISKSILDNVTMQCVKVPFPGKTYFHVVYFRSLLALPEFRTNAAVSFMQILDGYRNMKPSDKSSIYKGNEMSTYTQVNHINLYYQSILLW